MLAEVIEDAHFADFWNQVLMPKFVKDKHLLVDGLTHHSDAVFPSLPVRAGDHVLDLGCGLSDSAIRFAERVGPAGRVVGVDGCAAFLDYARADATTAGLVNLSFVEGAAATMAFEPKYDFVFARFGPLFFADPVAGLGNIRTALKPGGRLTHIVWRTRDAHPWLGLAKDAVLHTLPAPDEEQASCDLGPISSSGKQTVIRMMQAAGYENVTFTRVDAPVLVGRSVEDAMNVQLALGPAGPLLSITDAVSKRPEIEAALAGLGAADRDATQTALDTAAWVITGTNPIETIH